MTSLFSLLYHPEVRERDIPLIDARLARRIADATFNRLTTAPERYGTPLKRNLKGYWKLRVGDQRIVFRIVGREVWIYAILNRKVVYDQVRRRLGWPLPR